MGAPKKLKKAMQVTTILEESQHDHLKQMAYQQHRPMSELIREALLNYMGKPIPSSVNLMNLQGLGRALRGEDAQKYVKQLRDEWR